MDQELERVYNLIQEARDPEDLLGVEPVVLPRSNQLERRRQQYDTLKAITALRYTSPDDAEMARDLDRRLEDFYRQAQSRIEIGAYNLQGRGKPIPALYRSRSFHIGGKRYYVGPQFRRGEETVLYQGYLEVGEELLGEVLLKVASAPETSRFIDREANVLGLMRKEEYRETGYLPVVLDRFDAEGRMGLVMRRLDGFNLQEVREYPPHRNGLDPRDMVWMLRRTLSVLGWAHHNGIVHGRICPQHVVIDPVVHHVLVVGWGGAALEPARSGQRILAPVEIFSAPEADGPTIGPWSDVYSTGKTYIWLLGGDPKIDRIPEQVEPELATFLRKMVHPDVYRRPESCWELLETLDALKAALWGEAKFRHLEMPQPTIFG